MKTLDEVIEALEEAGDFVAECAYCSGIYCNKSYRANKCYTGDALKYLRELKLFRQTPIMQGIHKAQRECALYPVSDFGKDEPDFNPLLDWEDLLRMDLKPVWVEWIYPVMEDETGCTEDEIETEGYWATVIVQGGNHIYLNWISRGIHKMLHDNQTEIYQDTIGSRWMAYRKERK